MQFLGIEILKSVTLLKKMLKMPLSYINQNVVITTQRKFRTELGDDPPKRMFTYV